MEGYNDKYSLQGRSNIDLYLMDCMAGLSRFKDNYFRVAIIDPPYGIGMDGGKMGFGGVAEAKDYTKKDWDGSAPEKEFFDELMRVSENQIIWGANHFISRIPYDSPCWVVWDKKNGEGYFADVELAWTSFTRAAKMVRWRWRGMLQEHHGMYKEKRIHPTQKPVALYRFLIDNFSEKGDRILDTHLGSASIALAAWDLGRDLVGFEIDEEYFNDAVKRIKDHVLQLKLF